MKIVVTGSGGQLASAMRLTLPADVGNPTWLDRADLDITDAADVATHEALDRADVVVNTAAYTSVDAAEDDIAGATAVNDTAVGHLAERCGREGAHLVHISTDYVFGSGALRHPLTPADPTNPDTVYGRTKLAGERRLEGTDATILRTAWVYSANLLPGHRDFVSTMLRLEREREELTVVDDQHGCPTYAADLAQVVWRAVRERPGGVSHAAGGGRATWYELACATFEQVGADPGRIRPVTSAEYPVRAPRPGWSVLASDWPLPEWRSSLTASVAGNMRPL
ncbi:dTDP-4-dehydrorhamnose reductase [Corynebacterium halotolerans]|uniref:dTDP-4-dehydrorhamnose reductase n=1 Tax=Corynebacterium halotolerans YIM 70093 = DSM 44683 TaxID=1121362 RepID=M1P4Z8_9CORY|nr:dTDP-4-dehydrorhamnose reductase [Corynebacterium halotolerans]AGF71741.1 dTDP-4-dehydrorhamnose reductase [Corynebacterium halotolerans YIM 70093 = DSM 44683]